MSEIDPSKAVRPECDICKCGEPRSEHAPFGGACQSPDCAGNDSRLDPVSGRCARFTFSHYDTTRAL